MFKRRLKELRGERNLSQKQVAEACGISPTCICQLETGARNPTGTTLSQLADFFEVSTDYLLGREDDFGNRVLQECNRRFKSSSLRQEKTRTKKGACFFIVALFSPIFPPIPLQNVTKLCHFFYSFARTLNLSSS